MSNGYTTIEINGEPVGLCFGLPAVKYIGEKAKDVQLFKNDGTYTEEGIARILFAGYKNHCLLEDQKETLPFKPFYLLIQEAVLNPETIEPIKDALKVFEESRIVQSVLPKAAEDTKKKNGRGTKSNVSATGS